jgi:hypothetical protein
VWLFNSTIFDIIKYPQPQGLGGPPGMINLKKKIFLQFSQSLLFIIVKNVKNYGFGSFLGIPEAIGVLWIVVQGWPGAEVQPLLLYKNLNFLHYFNL